MLLLIASFIDLEHQIIPNVVSLPGIILGLVLNYNHDEYFITIFGGAIISAAILWLFRWGGMVFKKKEMMGLGDVKLAGMIGAFLGSGKSLVALFFGVLLGIMIWSILMAFKLKSRRDYIPFGFFLGLGALVALFWGQEIINWYWGLFTITP
jgi:leader peptidase (prepilin peptidase)/N-methyltransferase